MVRTQNQVTGRCSSIARKPGFGAERYLYGVQLNEIACRKFFPEPQRVVEAPDPEVSEGLQQWELAKRSKKEMREAIEM